MQGLKLIIEDVARLMWLGGDPTFFWENENSSTIYRFEAL